MRNLARAAGLRLGQAVLTLVGSSIILWVLLLAMPGDPAMRILLARGVQDPTPAQIAQVRAELGLNDGVVHRFLTWVLGAIHGDFGPSWQTGRPVVEEFATRLPATLRLGVTALAMAVAIAVLMALVGARWRSHWPAGAVRTAEIVSIATPGFLIGLVILEVVVLRLKLGRILADGTWGTVGLPALTLCLGSAGSWSRILRAAILDQLHAGYLVTSAARGSSATRRLLVHAFPNALPPFLTMVAMGAAGILAGTPVIEAVFTWPGVGNFLVGAINTRDRPVVLMFTITTVLAYVVASLVTDVVLALIDPRRRGEKA